MKILSQKWYCLLLVMLFVISMSIAGCSNDDSTANGGENNSSASSDTIKILLIGDKPIGFDDVLDEYENRTSDTLGINLDVNWVSSADYKEKLNLEITSGTTYDLVFDAEWIYLKTLAADGYYADLSEYWNNDDYPGLKSAFSESLIENNTYYGQQCVIPIIRTYGTGVPAVFYRQDWADEWGIGSIDSYKDLTAYWDACLENEAGVTPLSVSDTRGYYQLLSNEDLSDYGIQAIAAANTTFYIYVKDGELKSIAVEGEGDDAFADFPEPYNYDFSTERYQQFAEWRSEGYTEIDSQNQTDAFTMFYSGLGASMISTLDDAEEHIAELGKYSPDAEIGFFVYPELIRNQEDNALTTGYKANNFLAVPEDSKNKDLVMKFLDWLFADEANHDLFELGIEGKDWEDAGDGLYTALSDYSFPGYVMTWNQNYVNFSSELPEEILAYKQYELLDSTFKPNVLPGFSFDQTNAETAIAQTKAITNLVATMKLHGILSDGTTEYATAADMLKSNIDLAYDNGLDDVKNELATQIEAFLNEQ